MHLRCRHRFRQSPDGELAERSERVALATRQHTHQVGQDDLTGSGGGAQTRGLDDGWAEEIFVVLRRLARRHADANLQRLTMSGARGNVGGLLHGDGAGDGVGSAVERQHQAVAGGLHLASVVLPDGRTQRAEVFLPQRLVGIVPESIRQLGRADEVGEDDGDGLGVRH
jgi:hypothetical protein